MLTSKAMQVPQTISFMVKIQQEKLFRLQLAALPGLPLENLALLRQEIQLSLELRPMLQILF